MFTSIRPGEYTLVIIAAGGFAGQTQPLRVAARPMRIAIHLNLESVSQSVSVGAEPALSTSPEDNKDAVAVTGKALKNLPVFDQNIVSTLLPFLDPGALGAGGATIMVDGVEMKASTVSPSAIAEVKLNNDPYSAEFSRPGRGRIDIITKPGSPVFHGELNLIARDAVFNAKNYFSPIKPPEQWRIYEGHLTGPVGDGGHTTFLISGQRKEMDSEVAVHAVLSSRLLDENVAAPQRFTQLTGRISHDFSPQHRFGVAYNFEFGTRTNNGVGGIVLPEAGVNTTSREDDAIFNDRVIISPTWLNQLQVTFEKDEDITRSVTPAPSIQVQDSFTGGGAQADLHRTENTVHISEVVSWTHKNHYVRFGANIPQISRRAVDDGTNRLGTLTYQSLAAYTADTGRTHPHVLTEQAGPGRGLYWINEFGAFVQDSIKVSPKLQVTLGLRYQWQTYMDSVKNFAPRASAAYSINQKTILRVGAGVFYDRTGGDYPATFKLHNGVVLQSVQLFGETLPPGSNLEGYPQSLVREAPSLGSPYLIQDSIDIERQLTPTLTLSTGYHGLVGVDSFRSRDVNAPVSPLNARPGGIYPRPDPALGRVQQIEATGRQISNSLDVLLRGRIGTRIEGQAQYTLSRAYDNTAGINAFPEDQYAPNLDWGRASYDRLHRFNLLASLNQGHWLSVGIAATLYSGAPYTELSGADPFQTGLGNARPVGVTRNSLQGAGTEDIDLLWDHDVRLTRATGDHAKVLNFGVSAFNLLNHANFTNYVGTVSSPLFHQPTVAAAARQMQFGLRYEF